MCLKPQRIKTKLNSNNGGKVPVVIVVPCGKCDNCKMDKNKEWYIRLLFESKEQLKNDKPCIFATLTYNEDSYKLRKDLKDFKKDLRNLHQNLWLLNGDMKFFAVLEKGSKSTKRKHWHVIYFGFPNKEECYVQRKKTFKLLNKYWKHGFTEADYYTIRGIKYITNYLNVEDQKEQVCRVMSKKLGLSYYQNNRNFEKDIQYGIKIDGVTFNVPRYYRKKNDHVKTLEDYIEEDEKKWDPFFRLAEKENVLKPVWLRRFPAEYYEDKISAMREDQKFFKENKE